MSWKRMWTVNFCDCGGYIFCSDCEMPCEHDQLCPQCRGYDWYPAKLRDAIDYLVAADVGWLYRTKADAMASIEQ